MNPIVKNVISCRNFSRSGKQNITLPVTATSTAGAGKVGTATSTTYFGSGAEGDASIDTAKKNGGITTVSSVDVSVDSILGIITTLHHYRARQLIRPYRL